MGLIAQGADVNSPNVRDITPLAAAAHKGNVGIMTVLLNAGALVNGLNSNGSTALIQASHFGHDDAVHLLLARGASADMTNSKGTTALMRASQEGHVRITSSLVHAGSDVNRKNNEGMNALMLASQRGHDLIVDLLITNGAQADVQTAQGSTALMLACKRGHTKVVETLVSHGAEIFVRDNRGRTAMDTAVRRMHVNLIPMLSTPYQVNAMQLREDMARREIIDRLRQAYNDRTLQFNPEVAEAMETLKGHKSLAPPQAIGNFCSAIDLSKYVSSPECSKEHRFSDTKGWTWPVTMMKIISMPMGVFEHIVDFIPAPRVWENSLVRVASRAKLSPQQAILDTSVIIDEILCDLRVFTDSNQKMLLVRLSRCPSAISYLKNELDMPAHLIDLLLTWADIQSLSSRVSEAEVIFRVGFARSFIGVAVKLFKWYRSVNSPTRLSDCLNNTAVDRHSGMSRTDSADSRTNALEHPLMDADDIITDAGGDEEEGDEEDQDSNFQSMVEAAVVANVERAVP